MVGSPARTDEESSKQQQQTNRIAIEDGADSNPPPASAARDLLRPVGRAIVSIRVISTTTTCEHNSHMVVVNVFCSFSFCVGDGGDMAEAHVHDLWYGYGMVPLSFISTGVFNALSDVVTGDIVVMASTLIWYLIVLLPRRRN